MFDIVIVSYILTPMLYGKRKLENPKSKKPFGTLL